MSYIEHLPVDVLKIDKTFVDCLGSDAKRSALLRTIIELGTAFDLDTVAEGIEHPAQLHELRALECGFGQGYLLGRPADAETIERLITSEDPDRPTEPTGPLYVP